MEEKENQSEEDIEKVEKSKGQIDGNIAFETPIIAPLSCTYHRGKRDVFATSKRQRSIPSQNTKALDKGKEKMKSVEQKAPVRRSKRIKNASQGPLFVDLDSDNEDQGMHTKLLLLEKYA